MGGVETPYCEEYADDASEGHKSCFRGYIAANTLGGSYDDLDFHR